MTTIDELRDQLEQLATSGPAHSADDLYQAATGPNRRPMRSRRPALAVGVAVALVAAALVTWRVWPAGTVKVSTRPDVTSTVPAAFGPSTAITPKAAPMARVRRRPNSART